MKTNKIIMDNFTFALLSTLKRTIQKHKITKKEIVKEIDLIIKTSNNENKRIKKSN
jgi:hypothetical protein